MTKTISFRVDAIKAREIRIAAANRDMNRSAFILAAVEDKMKEAQHEAKDEQQIAPAAQVS